MPQAPAKALATHQRLMGLPGPRRTGSHAADGPPGFNGPVSPALRPMLERLRCASQRPAREPTPPAPLELDPAPRLPRRPPGRELKATLEAHCPSIADPLRRLAERATFGANLEELFLVYTLGYEGYLEYHLNYDAIDDSALTARLAQFPTLQDSPREAVIRRYVNGDFSAAEELVESTILRAAQSKRQLYERMVEFWTDHFNIFLYKDACETFKPIDDRDVIRPYALDTFYNLLLATARSPAMLTYLDNASSLAGEPNQNYARELFELHGLGVGNYTQKDIEEVARCFTGWTINYDFDSPQLGQFQFNPDWHDDGPKNVLGRRIHANGGVRDGERVLQILCFDNDIAPLTARFVGGKLLRNLWGYEPPEELLQSVAHAFLTTGGDIRTIVRAALHPRWISCAAPKLKRPFHLAISAIRGMFGQINEFDYLRYILFTLGQHPFYWAPPNGYPDSVGYWSGHILPRWRFGTWLLEEQGDIELGAAAPIILAGSDTAVIEMIDLYLFGLTLPGEQRAVLSRYLSGDHYTARPAGQFPFRRILESIELAIAAPAFQWY